LKRFGQYAWTVLAFNVAVIAWGGFVRATGSGAGCGRHWPTCQGQVVPRSPAMETSIEFAHRTTSAVALLLVVGLVIWAWRAFPRGHPTRTAALFSLVFIVVEALVGAGLVLFGWVARDASAARGWVMAIHLVNTFLLLASVALAACWSRHPPDAVAVPERRLAGMLAVAALAVLAVGVSGAIAALGDTLFPATSFTEGLRQDLAGQSRLLLRLRLMHPPLAAFAVLWLLWTAVTARARSSAPRAAVAVAGLAAMQLAAGIVNLALLAPVWMQVLHLVLADATWVALVILGAAVRGLPAVTGRSKADAVVPSVGAG
jgi:heme a synthase